MIEYKRPPRQKVIHERANGVRSEALCNAPLSHQNTYCGADSVEVNNRLGKWCDDQYKREEVGGLDEVSSP